jgi:diguanylate cyclase (GGDEF)-like protein
MTINRLFFYMKNEFTFDGFREFIQLPLEKEDPRSFHFIRNVLQEQKHPPHEPFRFLMQHFVDIKCREREALDHWRCMLRHKEDLESKLCRRIGINAALYDYFDTFERSAQSHGSFNFISSDRKTIPQTVTQDESITRICSPGNPLEFFKKEVFRAKRYKHSLSVIMLEVDDFPKINQTFSKVAGEGILTIIVNIIKTTIRIVDSLYNYADNRFVIILPNTNKREAIELSERIRQNICERTKRIMGTAGVTATLSVGQTMATSNSVEFLKHIEIILEEGKKQKCNMVYFL